MQHKPHLLGLHFVSKQAFCTLESAMLYIWDLSGCNLPLLFAQIIFAIQDAYSEGYKWAFCCENKYLRLQYCTQKGAAICNCCNKGAKFALLFFHSKKKWCNFAPLKCNTSSTFNFGVRLCTRTSIFAPLKVQ